MSDSAPLRVFYHPSFDNPQQKKKILADIPGLSKFQQDSKKVSKLCSKNLAAEMRPCYEAPLLNVEQEQHLFRKMNYFKYKAKKLLSLKSTVKRQEKIDYLLKSATDIRNQIAESNFRLATQLLKVQITFYREHTLIDSLLSDAYFDVLKSVDYFNWTLGHRFSTYATWVVKKNFFRDSKQKIVHFEKFQYLADQQAEQIYARNDGHQDEVNYTNHQELVKRLLKLLAEGEKTTDRSRQVFVLESYFGINGQQRQTLEEISKKIGVTKERVRQLKEKGLDWIRDKVEELGIDSEII